MVGCKHSTILSLRRGYKITPLSLRTISRWVHATRVDYEAALEVSRKHFPRWDKPYKRAFIVRSDGNMRVKKSYLFTVMVIRQCKSADSPIIYKTKHMRKHRITVDMPIWNNDYELSYAWYERRKKYFPWMYFYLKAKLCKIWTN